jgi:hypothetical protein
MDEDEVTCSECGDPVDEDGWDSIWDGVQGTDVPVCPACYADATEKEGRWPSGTACVDCEREDQDFATGWPEPVCKECASGKV